MFWMKKRKTLPPVDFTDCIVPKLPEYGVNLETLLTPGFLGEVHSVYAIPFQGIYYKFPITYF